MPHKPGSFINTHRGVQRLLNDELAKGLGVPKAWLSDIYPSGKSVANTVSLHLLEGLTPSLVSQEQKSTAEPTTCEESWPEYTTYDESTIQWHPPDLTEGHAWHRECLEGLLQAALEYDSPGPLIEEGMQMIACH
jgi:hypothetical protein